MTAANHRLDLDTGFLGALLDGPHADKRHRGREVAEHADAHLPDDLTLDQKREATKEALHHVVDSGMTQLPLPVDAGGKNDHAGYVSGFEELVASSPSLQIKAGVQFGLFGGAIQHLGNAEQQAKWLLPALKGELLGSFAMTEIGHGSDVASLGTTALYDPADDSFVLDTPFRAATKEYIGNAACHAQAAVVFAKLIVDGVDHGVHVLFVPVRDEDGAPMPGVSFEDDGYKGGLPGVDNGRIAFDHVRVPRTNLLDRYGAVDADGVYSSPIESPGRRFFTMLSTLVQGRVSLDGAATVAEKLALDIAIRYGLERRQFSGAGDAETVLLDYGRHQRRLMPRLARAYADAFAHEKLLESFQAVFSGADDSEAAQQRLETEAAGFKAMTTWNALDTIQVCREACGGAGFMAENRLVGLHADLDVFATFEGDNTVLLQLVGKRLLGDYSEELRHIDFGGAARLIGSQAAEYSLYRSGLANVGRTIGDLFTPALNASRIRSGKMQEALLASRVESMVAQVAQDLRPAAKADPATAAALFNDNQHALIEAAQAYVELLKWQALNEAMHAVDAKAHPSEAKVLRRIRDLFGLSLIEEHIGWHIMFGRLSMARARQIGPAIDRLCRKLRDNAAELVGAFGYGPAQRRSAIAEGAEAERQEEAAEYLRRERAKADAPVDEKVLHRRRKAEAKAAKGAQKS
ncbi:acyl-CoA dehydrogenase family protein [Brevibacterium sp. BRM-1]|uniref:acyl-CoA dehydrogenase family protein n=1 Tax=Brevibacterium sp. BRM-1 TaxID=2999062 RepID=UPI00227E3024|nr:acyl-CoA dehydrogenase [Brevibacterium sp. BRM-1]WAL40802.1 acyl-CoA dehydrogenase family protein [Brevibacterium sp. BRM-1]